MTLNFGIATQLSDDNVKYLPKQMNFPVIFTLIGKRCTEPYLQKRYTTTKLLYCRDISHNVEEKQKK